MARSVDLSVPTWVQQAAVVGIFVLLAAPVLSLVLVPAFDGLAVPGGKVTAFVVSAGVPLALAVALVARARGRDAEDSVWGAIPGWQYAGRHAESGGIARAEQERALEELGDEE